MEYFCPAAADFTCSSSTSPSSSSAGMVSYNGKAPVAAGGSGGLFEGSAVKFQPNLHGISNDWTPEEQAILEEGMITYASESSIVRYSKIAMHLDNKTIRDVALRCRWMTKRDFSKRRKEEFNLTRKSKDRKEKIPDPTAMSSHAVMQSGFPRYAQGVLTNNNDDGLLCNATGGVTWQLLQQNARAFEQISANLSTHQIHENIGLLCRARDNIVQILNNLSDQPSNGKHMPPLPVKVNEGLANTILPASTIRMQ